jgi:hypothetical protein
MVKKCFRFLFSILNFWQQSFNPILMGLKTIVTGNEKTQKISTEKVTKLQGVCKPKMTLDSCGKEPRKGWEI